MKDVTLRRENNGTFTDLTYPFRELGTVVSHLHPRFVIVSSGYKWSHNWTHYNLDPVMTKSVQMLIVLHHQWTARVPMPEAGCPFLAEDDDELDIVDDDGSNSSQDDPSRHTPPRRLLPTTVHRWLVRRPRDDDGSEIDFRKHTPPRHLRPTIVEYWVDPNFPLERDGDDDGLNICEDDLVHIDPRHLRPISTKRRTDSKFLPKPENNEGTESDSTYRPPARHQHLQRVSRKRRGDSPTHGSPRPHQRVRFSSDTTSARLREDEVLEELDQDLSSETLDESVNGE